MRHQTSATAMLQRSLWAAWPIAGALVLASPTTVLAEEAPNLLEDPFQLSLGAFLVTSEPVIELRGETGAGGKVNFDDELGGGDSQRFRLDGTWRFADRHKLRAFAFSVNRDNRRTIDEEFEWGGDIYPVNADLKTDFSFSIVQLAYEYAFLRRENYEVGASFGLHYTTLDASLKATRDDGDTVLNVSNDASVDLPLPVVGLRGLVKLPYNLWFDASAQFFALSIDEYDGNLQDYRAMLVWQPKSWLGLGLGYNVFSVDVDVEKSSFDGSLDWTYDGPMAYYSVSF